MTSLDRDPRTIVRWDNLLHAPDCELENYSYPDVLRLPIDYRRTFVSLAAIAGVVITAARCGIVRPVQGDVAEPTVSRDRSTMGTTFVGIGEHGFWMRDGVLELWLRLLALHLEDPADDSSPCDAIRSQWLLASRGYFNGCVPFDIESDVSTDAGRQLILDAITSLRRYLQDAPDTLDYHVLNLLGFSEPLFANPETWRLLEVADAFVDLIEGRVTSTAESTEWMPGSSERD